MNELSVLCFLSVTDTHSFSNTARELKITQQAVSRHIQNLEEELGFPLLIRDQNFVTPTAAGTYLLKFFQDSNMRLQEIADKTAPIMNTVIRIGISDWIGNAFWIRQAALDFRIKYPDQSLFFYELNAKEAQELINHQLLDCYLTTNYELEHILVPFTKIAVAQTNLCLGVSSERWTKNFHLCTAAGETEELSIQARDLKLYTELGLSPKTLKLYPNNASVHLNASIGNGSCFALTCSQIVKNPHLTFQPLSRKVDLVLGVFQKSSPKTFSILAEMMGGNL